MHTPFSYSCVGFLLSSYPHIRHLVISIKHSGCGRLTVSVKKICSQAGFDELETGFDEELVGLFVEEELTGFSTGFVEELDELLELLETGFSVVDKLEALDELSTGADELAVVDEFSSTLVETLEETLWDELSVEETVSDDISAEAAELVLSFAVLFEQPTSKSAVTAIAIIFFIVITSKCLIYFIISHFSRFVNNFFAAVNSIQAQDKTIKLSAPSKNNLRA